MQLALDLGIHKLSCRSVDQTMCHADRPRESPEAPSHRRLGPARPGPRCRGPTSRSILHQRLDHGLVGVKLAAVEQFGLDLSLRIGVDPRQKSPRRWCAHEPASISSTRQPERFGRAQPTTPALAKAAAVRPRREIIGVLSNRPRIQLRSIGPPDIVQQRTGGRRVHHRLAVKNPV